MLSLALCGMTWKAQSPPYKMTVICQLLRAGKVEHLEADFREEMAKVKREHDRALAILDDGLVNTKAQAERSMQERLARRCADRKKALMSQGKSEAEANEKSEQELVQARTVEEQVLNAEFAESNNLISGSTSAGLSESEIEKKVNNDLVAEEMLRKMTDIQDSIEKERAMAELNRKQAELEKSILDRTQAEAARAAKNAAQMQADADEKLAALRKKQQEETARLQDEMDVQKKKNSDDLKRRLKEKKAAKMRALEASKASDKEKAEEIALLEEDAHQQEFMVEKVASEEESSRLAALEQQQIAAEEEVLKKVSEAQAAAARLPLKLPP